MRVSQLSGMGLACTVAASSINGSKASKPSIIMIMSHDKDLRLESSDFQSVLHRDIFAEGVQFTNYFATTALCCPSLASLLRGQAYG
jgi:N-acetylglucosamine-6-sulfatase